jgi:hypothetical protein
MTALSSDKIKASVRLKVYFCDALLITVVLWNSTRTRESSTEILLALASHHQKDSGPSIFRCAILGESGPYPAAQSWRLDRRSIRGHRDGMAVGGERVPPGTRAAPFVFLFGGRYR